ncbi:B-cell receptor CD22-like isoform X2 [Cheilinus undulatus]|uniref:B-cell receptor CD22-like isoform X2 n=1 Tax=Cheilinus undulatus TaxID=241271 RepID=UPI001BD35CDB|nr:B-cell receptor CD22-like isoform X2 [Cheilinus undulatus]
MISTSAAGGFTVLLFVQVVQSQTDWGVTYSQTKVCALEGSTVELSCTYSYPNYYYYVITSFWFTKIQNNEPVDVRTDSQYTGRVEYSCEGKRCTLRIINVEKSDSATYRFRFITNLDGGRYMGNPGVILSVKDPDLQVQRIDSWSSKLQLKCLSRCLLPHLVSYVWYKNGQKISAEKSFYSAEYFYADSYSCALKGYEDFPSPLYCYYDSSCNKVKYTHRTICAPRGSSVDISCSCRSYESISSKFWFRSEHSQQWQYYLQPKDLRQDSQYRNRVQVTDSRRGDTSTLRISDLRRNDSAVYHFKFTAGSSGWGNSLHGTALTVTDLQVQVMKITTYHSYTEAELRCHSSCSEADRLSYVWSRNRQTVDWESKSTYKVIYDLEDEISCALKGQEGFPSSSVYAPMVPSVVWNPPGEIVENSSVTLTCSTDANPAANITWFKKNEPQDFKPSSSDQQLIFSSIQSSDSGEYGCTAENSLGRRTSADIVVDVKYAPKLPSVSVIPSAEIVEGSSVTLTCSSDANPAAKYTWYKENQTLPQGQNGTYSFTTIQSKDSGIYSCKSENKYGPKTSKGVCIDVQYAPRPPSLSLSPSAAVVEGTSLNLTCSSDANPAAKYSWYKENEETSVASGQIFIISDIRSEHGGNYYCEAHNRRGRHNSTLHLVVVSGSMKSVTAGLVTFFFLVVILLCIFLFIRKKRSSGETNKPGRRQDNKGQLNLASANDYPSASARTQPAEEQEDLCYATVSFSKNNEDPLYSNILQAKLDRPKTKNEEEEDDVEYSVVNFASASSLPESRRQEVVEDASELYSMVSKKPRA